MTQFEIVQAAYRPKDSASVNPESIARVGQLYDWLAHHIIEPGEHPGCEGEWLMRNVSEYASPIEWVPLSDLDVTT